MNTLIVPTDFSAASVNAAYYATDMALAIGANISLIHIVPFPIAFSEIPVPSSSFDIMLDDAKMEMKNLQEKLALRSDDKIIISTVVIMGNFLNEINVLADKIKPAAIILGIQGNGASEKKVFGSNALSAMHNLIFPVIIIPQTACFKKITKVALACDMNDVSETLPIDKIEDIIGMFNCKFDIINVSSPKENKYASLLNESISLQKLLTKFHPEIHFTANKNISAGVTEFIKAKEIDLLLVVPKKHGFFDFIFHKSISNEMSMHIQIPILTLHRE